MKTVEGESHRTYRRWNSVDEMSKKKPTYRRGDRIEEENDVDEEDNEIAKKFV
jgi:hypothetical protein